MSWYRNGGAFSRGTGKPYNFINQILLGDDHEYVTFNQIKKENGHLNKGSKAKYVYGWKLVTTQETVENEDGEEEIKERSHWILRCTPVFDVLDTNLTPHERFEGKAETSKDAEKVAKDYVERSGINFKCQGSNDAYYDQSTDTVVVPNVKQFNETSEYYDTLFHEFVHSTGRKGRLDRLDENSMTMFGGEDYSKEELVAELGSAMLVNRCGLETKSQFDNATAYIKGWLKSLKNDRTLIVNASSKAEKAVKYILDEK